MRSDVNFQISRAGLSHPARVLTNQIACFTVVIIQQIFLTCDNLWVFKGRMEMLLKKRE